MKRYIIILLVLCFSVTFASDSWAKVIGSEELEPSRAHIRFSPEAQALIKTAARAEKEQDWKAVAENYQKALELYSQYLINASVLNNKTGASPEITVSSPRWGLNQPIPDGLGAIPDIRRDGRDGVYPASAGLRLRNNDLYWGVQYFCRNALRNMPAEGRKTYNNMFEPVARHVFENVVKNRLDINKLEQLAERYALTESGRQALTLLLRWHLERGELFKASGYYRELKLNHPRDAEVLFERKIVEDIMAGKPSDVEWQTYCGNNTRSKIMPARSTEESATSPQTVPLIGKGYSFSWNSYFKLPDHVVNLSRRPPNNPNINYPIAPQESIPYFPAVSNNMIYLPTGSGIYAFELSELKDEKMPYDLSAPYGAQAEMKVKWKVEDDTSNQGFQEERTINTVTLSADGKRLYAPLISSYEKHERRLGFLDVKYPFPRRSLVCLDTSTAKRLWTSDKVPYSKDGGNPLEDIIFPVAPAEENDVLYVAGLRMPKQVDIPEHYLFACNARNGAVYFKTFIGSGILETNLFNNPSREPMASAVTVDSDNIYYCSQMGIITAVDKYTGAIKWLKKYEEYFIPTTWPNYTPPHLPLRWINNPIIRIDNTSFAEKQGQPARLDDASRSGGILVTAIDSPFLYLISANTGEELWRWNGDNAPLGNVRHLVGVKDGFLVVSGESGIICLNLNKGADVAWKADDKNYFGKDFRFIGKGAITDGKIYVTSDDYMLYEIGLKTGELINKQFLQGKEDAQPAANLLVVGDFLIRNSIGQMNIYRIESKKETVDSPR